MRLVDVRNHICSRYAECLKDKLVDIVCIEDGKLTIGWPTFVHSGTGYWEIRLLKSGKISVREAYCDESMRNNRDKVIQTWTAYRDVDSWMGEMGYSPSEKATSAKRSNFRN
jgi:hypothetical protein